MTSCTPFPRASNSAPPRSRSSVSLLAQYVGTGVGLAATSPSPITATPLPSPSCISHCCLIHSFTAPHRTAPHLTSPHRAWPPSSPTLINYARERPVLDAIPMPSSTSPQPRLPLSLLLPLLLSSAALTSAQAACYWAAGPQYRLPESAGVVPCDENGYSACCKLGDICLAGNACYNFETDDTYQYGCSDPSYKDPSCPFKCDWNPDASPWVALEYCPSFNGINDTWTCQSPESCGCEWRSTYSLLQVPIRDCQAMGSNARVAIYATNTLPAYLILPQTYGGSTQYFSKGQTGNTPIGGCTILPFATHSGLSPSDLSSV
ncbi:hypothetical protein BDY17DRAFT_13404 [Neohortaea acidophila]|uniref:Uncharacterized protein n=1 Tax=Neohortaea acidophila TaxID=245834 RepID=A0A6A6Q653_9PEZI|nr:uncharacterized protein BDY17DRAFT_13404 [Neohortaea acidophila]KAF2487551.1 hypothetical protein BDY17DRAFT_13404 [Neohortaea acidophila]